jgi:hypothetical protein
VHPRVDERSSPVARTFSFVLPPPRSRQRDPRPRSSSPSLIPHLPPTQGIVGEVGVAFQLSVDGKLGINATKMQIQTLGGDGRNAPKPVVNIGPPHQW